MNIVDKSIASLFPGWALGRVRARHAIDAYARAYEAAKPSRLRKKRADRGNGDAVIANAGDNLRVQARHLDENHDLARGILNSLVNNVVGVGIRVEPQVKDKNGEHIRDFNRALLDLFKDWSRCPEVTWEYHWHEVQRKAARAWFRDGEVLAQLLEGNVTSLDHGTRVPFSIELIEADQLPLDLFDSKKRIVQGVEKNAWGKPRAYYLTKEHPGDINAAFISRADTKRVSADSIIHLKLADRIKQTRGVPVFASVMIRLDDIKDYEESERVAARVAAAMCGFIRKSADAPTSSEDTDSATGNRLMKMQPGMIFDNLLPGEDVGTIESNRPNSGLEPFRNGQLRAVAAGTSTSYSSISKDYNGTYSAQRQELVEQSVHYAVLREYFIERFTRPLWERFVRMALLAGLVQQPPNIDENTLFDADFRGPSMPWIDPMKEITAEEKSVQAGFKSRSQVIREQGRNPDDVFEQIKRERKEEEEAGIVFTSNPAGKQGNSNEKDPLPSAAENEAAKDVQDSEIPPEEETDPSEGKQEPPAAG